VRRGAIDTLDWTQGAVDVENLSEMRDEREEARRAWSRSMLFAVLAILVALGGVIYVGVQIAIAIAEGTS
jgi:hypothetical protein